MPVSTEKAPGGADGVDIEARRADFPALRTAMHGRPLVYLDSAASAQKPYAVIEAMNRIYNEKYSNIHRGIYEISQALTEEFEGVRAKVAAFMGGEARGVVFTRNATEGINLVARSWGETALKAGDEIILTILEHHANIVPWQMLRDRTGAVIRVAPMDDTGVLDLEAFAGLLNDRTRLVAAGHVSNAIGTVNNISKIISLSKNFNPEIKVLIDGSQGVVHETVDVRALGCDFYVFTGHKLYGPTGIGVLYGHPDLLDAMPPYQGGGDMIERVTFDGTTYREAPYRFEAGTPAIVEAIGLGAAIDYVRAVGLNPIRSHEKRLLTHATAKLLEIPGLKLYGIGPDKAPVLSFTIEGASPSDIGMILDQQGVAVRTGHHCCMPLMERLGVPATVRASLGLYSDVNDMDRLVEGLHKARGLLL